jgi:hypothetical protein
MHYINNAIKIYINHQQKSTPIAKKHSICTCNCSEPFYQCFLFSLSYVQGCTNPGRLVTSVNKFRTVVPSIFSIITALFPPSRTKMCMGSHAPCRKCQITVRLTGHSWTVGSQNNCFRLPFWRPAFRDGSYIFGKSVNPSLSRMISQHTANRNAILRSWQRSTV